MSVFVNIGLSLDGYMPPEGMTPENWDNPSKRMFDAGARGWPESGGTTFIFVNDGPESAFEQARASAGGKDIRLAGGANVIQQYLNLGVVVELEIALAPVLFGVECAGRPISCKRQKTALLQVDSY